MDYEEGEVVWFSLDVEADGQSPITNSMLSLGICVFDAQGNELDALEVNILPREGCVEDPDTMEWWAGQPAAWEHCHQNQVSPAAAMWAVSKLYAKWAASHDVRWVAQPACFDWMWLKSYYDAFSSAGMTRIGFYCYCFSTMRKRWLETTGTLREHYNELCAAWTAGCAADSHTALEDARYQGREFLGFIGT